MGRGLALRLAKDHEVVIACRHFEDSVQVAAQLESLAQGFYESRMQGRIRAAPNEQAIEQSDTVFLAIPAQATLSTIEELKGYFKPKQTVVSTAVSMARKQGVFEHVALKENQPDKSAAELTQEIIQQASVVSALHTVPATYLNNLEQVLNIDVFVAGDEDPAVATASKLICEIPNLRPLRIGPLQSSRQLESMVPLLLNAATLNNLEEPSIRVVPWIPTSYGACK